MATKVKLVKDDTGPPLIFSLTDDFTGAPIDLSAGTTSLVFKMRAVGSTTIKETISMTKLTGLLNSDGTVTTTAPYDVAGYGGRCQLSWNSTALDTVGEFEGEIEITYAGPIVQTVYNLVKISIRADF